MLANRQWFCFFVRRCKYLSKRNNGWNKEIFKRYLSEGRGQGEDKDYKPWLVVQDFPSMGRVSRILGWKTKRTHHLFSDVQTRCFYIFDWDSRITDIREHYPLINADEVLENDKDINFNLFKDKDTGEPYILTTTFLITVEDTNGEKVYFARSIKTDNDLSKKTTMEKLEIERRYWKAKGVHWAIITQKDIPLQKAKNIEWIHSAMHQYKDFELSSKEMVSLCGEFLEYAGNSNLPIRKVSKDFDIKNGLKIGTALFLFRYLIAAKVIEINMDKEINLNSSLSELSQWKEVNEQYD